MLKFRFYFVENLIKEEMENKLKMVKSANLKSSNEIKLLTKEENTILFNPSLNISIDNDSLILSEVSVDELCDNRFNWPFGNVNRAFSEKLKSFFRLKSVPLTHPFFESNIGKRRVTI